MGATTRAYDHCEPLSSHLAHVLFTAKAETDLEGRASLSGLAPGDYWISSLNLDADAGDMRVRWDVPIRIERGRTIRIELSNLNSIDARSSAP